MNLIPPLLAACFLAGASARAFACASCGSGGDSPLVLYPNETFKIYTGYTRQQGIETMGASGKSVSSGGAERKDTLTVAAGMSFLTDFFATLTVPYSTNTRGDRSRSGLGDPLLSAHWTVLPTSLSSPWQPQVQLALSHKRHASRSVYDSQDDQWLDVLGNGFDETRATVDVWHGSERVKLGFAQSVQWPHARTIDAVERRPGRGYRTTLTSGYGLDSVGSKVLLGINREARDKRYSDGKAVADSEERSHSLFLTGDWKASELTMLRLSYTRSAALGQNKNTVRADNYTLAVMKSL